MKLAIAGDTMLGRNVGERLRHQPAHRLFSAELVSVAHEADLFVLNLECAISDRGERFPDRHKPFFFRGPPAAVDALTLLGVDCVTLANNHALDYGPVALLDTIRHLHAAGITCVGAGNDEASARAPAVLEHRGFRLGVVGVTDHPEEYAARPDAPGVAHADLRSGLPGWLDAVVQMRGVDALLVTPHWGPNMVAEPVRHVRASAAALRSAGATLVAGHSAHVFHGIGDRTLFDLGDFIDDYVRDPLLRNDLGIFALVTFEQSRPTEVECVPLVLDNCHTRLADEDEAAWVTRRLRRACSALGTEVWERRGRPVVSWDRETGREPT